ncbi:hypothetical protein GIB67_038578 [Kingdonia uniflora]|uniref:Surfeit locus protein 2 n=1 Tax=Kingdonia uniflora TaxID=39325 RepID=A0A7J7NPG9_9MAGN|nr:hypothetical protein GIB67_038578 [Kingdonia uniflora]
MEKKKKSMEGQNLLGSPIFEKLDNGRFKCVETSHEMPAKEMDSYSLCKRCRLGLIDSFLSKKKPPLNMFKQDPLSRSKLVCKLTGDTINKSEEHIWKHLNGKRFLNKLEQMETGKSTSSAMEGEKDEKKSNKGSKSSANGVKKKKKEKKENKKIEKPDEVVKGDTEEMKVADNNSDTEELDFWVPPTGSRWDFDNGADRWGSGTDSEEEEDDGNTTGEDSEEADEESGLESGKLTMRTKRMAIEVGPSSFASRKKKSKADTICDPNTT